MDITDGPKKRSGWVCAFPKRTRERYMNFFTLLHVIERISKSEKWAVCKLKKGFQANRWAQPEKNA